MDQKYSFFYKTIQGTFIIVPYIYKDLVNAWPEMLIVYLKIFMNILSHSESIIFVIDKKRNTCTSVSIILNFVFCLCLSLAVL